VIRCNDVIDFMEKHAPPALARDWDNIGLLVGRRNDIVTGIMTCLDITPEVVSEAVSKHANLIVSHHPIFIGGLSKINNVGLAESTVQELLRCGINAYCAHTNLDVAECGINFALAKDIGLNGIEQHLRGCTGFLPRVMKVWDFATYVKKGLETPFVRLIGNPNREVTKAVVFSGGFNDDWNFIYESHAEVLVTGEVKYHAAQEAVYRGLSIIEAGHFYTERKGMWMMADILQGVFGSDFDVHKTTVEKDCYYVW
jgi:dinuclear metal center YbgI/SA1388 family protein